MKYLLPIICIAILFVSCREDAMEMKPMNLAATSVNQVESESASGDLAFGGSTGDSNTKPDGGQNKYNRKVIRVAETKYKVEDVKKATRQLYDLANQLGGYISKEDLDKSNVRVLETIERGDSIFKRVAYLVKSKITMRIPSSGFNRAFKRIDEITLEEDFRNVEIFDVTEEYLDLEKRIENKKEAEARYIDILRKRTGKITEVLEAEKKIAEIREEIESMEGRLNYMKNKISLSTINILIYQDPREMLTSEINLYQEEEMLEEGFFFKLWDSLGDGWQLFTGMLLGILSVWPLWILLAFIYLIIRRVVKSKKK
jgi:hypothetical protein